jgi:uncharacterized membrane protein YgcG
MIVARCHGARPERLLAVSVAASVAVIVAAFVPFGLAGPHPVAAAEPVNLQYQLTDDVGALSPSQADEVEVALENLFDESGVQLMVWFTDTTRPMALSDFAVATAKLSSLNANDVLLVLAMDDRAMGYWRPDEFAISAPGIQRLVSAIAPTVKAGDKARAIVGFAKSLGEALASPGLTGEPTSTRAPTTTQTPARATGPGSSGSPFQVDLGILIAIITGALVVVCAARSTVARRRRSSSTAAGGTASFGGGERSSGGALGVSGCAEGLFIAVTGIPALFLGFLGVPLWWLETFQKSAVAILAFVAGPVSFYLMAKLIIGPLRRYLFHRGDHAMAYDVVQPGGPTGAPPMSFTAPPVPNVAAVSTLSAAPAPPGFYAIAGHVLTAAFSKEASSIVVDVLSGAVRRGDRVELIREDGSAVTVVTRGVEKAPDGSQLLRLESPRPLKEALGSVDVVRTPGLQAPPLPPDPAQAAVSRLVEPVRASRQAGFPIPPGPWWTPGQERAGQALSHRLARLPDEAVVLIVQKRLEAALAHHKDFDKLKDDCEAAAEHLWAIGLQEDGDRLVLAVAAALQGHEVGPSTRALASLVATGVVALEHSVEKAAFRAEGVAWALGIEMGDGFAVGYGGGTSTAGQRLEGWLVGAGRAVVLAWCDRCRDVVQLRPQASGSTAIGDLRCPADGRKGKDPLIVVPSDVAWVEQAVRSRHGVGRGPG